MPDTKLFDSIYVGLTVNRSYYLYSRSKAADWETEGNPLVEPVSVYSNVENGYGITTDSNTHMFGIKPTELGDFYYFQHSR